MNIRTFKVLAPRAKIGIVTVAYEFTDTGELIYGFAYCSPKEKHYVKKLGRKIAEERMRNNDHVPLKVVYPYGCLPIIPMLKALLLIDARFRGISWMKNTILEDIKNPSFDNRFTVDEW